MIKIKRGLDLPIAGSPKQELGIISRPRSVAILGRDYTGMKPTMLVQVGDQVKLGEKLFSDKKNPKVSYTAPGCGTISAINRGHQRALLSVVIALDEADSNENQQLSFPSFPASNLQQLKRQPVLDNLLESGLWTALRTRPYSKVPDPDVVPDSVFVNVMDTNPLAADPGLVLQGNENHFLAGLDVLAQIPQNKLYVCKEHSTGYDIDAAIDQHNFAENVELKYFAGVHPAGLSGTHIHFVKPAGFSRQQWYINYQDVVAIGKLFVSGCLDVHRIVSLAGPQVLEPRLIASRLGADLTEMTAGELLPGESRIISGSVLGGRQAAGFESYLGRYHLQVSIVREGRERPFLGYLSPGVNRHSVLGIYISGLYKNRKLRFGTSTQGSDRAMVPVGSYEKVMPLDILPTQLLRALIVGDLETAQNLGALELDEEDLALCSYVCPSKYEYGPILRDNLTRLEKEG